MIWGQRVMLDADLAFLYGVPLKRLNEQVQRNIQRFPTDFMFQLSVEEYLNLKSQIATSSLSHGGKRKPPYVFTEHCVAMLSSVLRSEKAMEGHIIDIISVLRKLTDEPVKPKGKIGFT